MRVDTPTRIAERTRLANIQLQSQNWLGRAANRVGLYIANSVDQLTSWADDDRVVFLGATSAGLIRGAAYGFIVTFVAAALFPLHTLALPLLFTLMAAGAIGYGVYDGQKGLERNLIKGNSKLADDVAIKFGAVPGKGIQSAPEKQTEQAADTGRKVVFTQREETRRADPPTSQR